MGSRHPGRKPRTRKTDRRVCVDTGGTFTDLIELSDGRARVEKVLSTPRHPEKAVLDALTRAGGPGGRLVHGSTVGLNAVLTRQGAKVALVTNKGFEDLCEIARQDRPELYTLEVGPKLTLVPRRLRFGVSDRRLADGRLESRTTPKELGELRERIRRSGAESIAVCLLHSFAHPEDEQRIARALEPLGLPVSLSSELLRRHREYERFSTALINAFILPKVGGYLRALEEAIHPMELHLVRNEGGSIPAGQALVEPVRTILSGPAGGVLGARFWAELSGFERSIGFDMGGTSADVALCVGDQEAEDQAEIGGHALALPALPVGSVGTGGGSLAWVDEGGALRVGPVSAGADPGPACYGKGTEPTVTDAHLFLGRLPSWGLLGGTFPIWPGRSERAIQDLGGRLGLSPRRTAEGILEVADLQMARPLRRYTLGRGLDPADFCLVGFGGAGGLHALRLAELCGFRAVVVPPHPGILSAMGMLLAQPVLEREEAWFGELDASSSRELEGRARAFLRQTRGRAPRGVRVDSARVLASVRYRGNNAEFWVPADREAARSFVEEFERRFGFVQDLPIEALRLRARLTLERGPDPDLGKWVAQAGSSSPDRNPSGRLGPGGLRCLPREDLKPGKVLRGPMAVLDHSGTTIVEQGWACRRHPSGALVLERMEGSKFPV